VAAADPPRASSAGSAMTPDFDLTGRKFGRWRVLRYACRENGATYWLCRCKCGREREVRADNLRRDLSTQCLWCANRNRGKKITRGRKTRTVPQWAIVLGISVSALRERLKRHPVDVALRKRLPKHQNGPPGRLLTFRGETMNQTKWAKRLGFSKQCLHARLKTMPVEEALSMPVSKKKKQVGRKAAHWRTRRGNQDTRTTPG